MKVNENIRAALSEHEIGLHVLDALERLILRDRHLFDVGANERSLTHRFACYLQQNLPDWDVDCEYNRDGHTPKELWLPGLHPDQEDSDAQTVFPDVVVHRRGTPDNYLVIEFKKNPGQRGRVTDITKLQYFKPQLGYRYALFVGLGVLHDPRGVVDVAWV